MKAALAVHRTQLAMQLLVLSQTVRGAGLKAMRLKRLKNKPHIRIYCDDLEKFIDKEGCYDAKGSMICRACLEKPASKKSYYS